MNRIIWRQRRLLPFSRWSGKSLAPNPWLRSAMRPMSSGFGPRLDREDEGTVLDGEVSCLMLHPVGWPNHGPQVELYLAEEAIGLVRSLDWTVVPGPTRNSLLDDEADEEGEASADEEGGRAGGAGKDPES